MNNDEEDDKGQQNTTGKYGMCFVILCFHPLFVVVVHLLFLFLPHCPFNIWEERLSGKGPKY